MASQKNGVNRITVEDYTEIVEPLWALMAAWQDFLFFMTNMLPLGTKALAFMISGGKIALLQGRCQETKNIFL